MNRRLFSARLCVLLLVVSALAACGVSTTDANTGSPPAASPTGPTPTPGPPTPTNVPAGWQVYSGPHFTIAFPAAWSASVTTEASSTPQRPDMVYGLGPGPHETWVTVNEQDGWDGTSIQQNFCANPTHDSTVTFAGLPMRFSTIEGGAMRSWLFVTGKGTIYGLSATDGFASKDHQAQDSAVLATFRAEYTTPGCAP